MSEITLSPATWTTMLAKTTAYERAGALAGLFPSGGSVEFRSATDMLIRTVTFGPWMVGRLTAGSYPAISGEFVDAAAGSGTPAVAVFKSGTTEIFRCTCGLDSGFYRILAALVDGVPIQRGTFSVGVVPKPGETPPPDPEEPPVDALLVTGVPQAIDITQGETYALVQHASGGVPPYSFSITGGSLPAGVTMSAVGLLSAANNAIVALSGGITFKLTDSEVVAGPGMAPENIAPPSITGNAAVGQSLTVTDGQWAYGPVATSRQWFRGSSFTGSTGTSYTVAQADEGQLLTVVVTATNSVGSTQATSAPTATVQGVPVGSAPQNVTPPKISGASTVGSTLSVSDGVWLNAPTQYLRQWMRDEQPIGNAIGATYMLGPVDNGTSISCFITARNTAGDESITTAPVGPVTTQAASSIPVSIGQPSFYLWDEAIYQVGYPLTISHSEWSNDPTEYLYQWTRDYAIIPGATSETYYLTAADVGKTMRCTVRAKNAAGTSLPRDTSSYEAKIPQALTQTQRPALWSSGPVVLGRPRVGEPLSAKVSMWDNRPHTFLFQWRRGAADIAGANQSYYYPQVADVGSKISCRVTARNPIGDTVVTTPQTDTVVAALAARPIVLPKFGVVSVSGGTDLPFTFLHGFAKGHVPAGKVPLLSGLGACSSSVVNTYEDGSARFVWISGQATLTAGVKKEWQIVSGNAPAGAAPSLASIRSSLTSGSIQVGNYETVSLADLVAGDPSDMFGSGNAFLFQNSQCSYWVWRKRIYGSPHLEVFVPIRLYSGGAVEIDRPWLQNGDLFVPGPMDYPAMTLKVTLNGTVRYDYSAGVKSRRTLPLVAGLSVDQSYWYGANPKIRPVHDTLYLSEVAKVVPRYRDISSAPYLDSAPQSYTPNWIGQTDGGEASRPGYEAIGVLPQWAARWVNSNADPRAYDTMVANGLAAGTRPVHFRDGGGYGNNTGLYPNFHQWPNITIGSNNSSPKIPMATVGYPDIDGAHLPQWTYGAWIASGSIYFFEEMQAFQSWVPMGQEKKYTQRGDLLISDQLQTRGAAWALRSLGHLCASIPDSHAHRSQWMNAMIANSARHAGEWIDGSYDYGRSSNPMGIVFGNIYAYGYGGTPGDGPYGPKSVTRYISPWQSNFNGMAWKTIKDLDLPTSLRARSQADAIARHSMMLPIQLAGGMGSPWPYTYFDSYSCPGTYTVPDFDPNWRWLKNFGEVWADVRDGFSKTDINPPMGQAIGALGYPVSVGEWAESSRVAVHLGLLVMAVEEGMPDAAARLAYIEGASNFDTSYMGKSPTFAFKARA